MVAIGASAGGIEALQHFFSNVPDDLGLAYVVVIHLAPDRPSDLANILARHTGMPVAQVDDHETTKLEPNRVYVIAPDRKLEITDSSISASRFEQPRGQRAAIDLLFRSLAARHGDGFAVILSGSGSDGALGARAVKEAGGLILVQDPREAGHESMPRAVISTGLADVVLPVRQLAERLGVLARSKAEVSGLFQTAEQDVLIEETEERSLYRVLDLLRKRTSHDFSKYKRATVLRRLGRRMQLSHRVTLPEYLAYMQENVEEIQALFDDLLISVTTFFRDPETWQTLQERVIAPLVGEAGDDMPIRAWVPGCATGEEAYTLAMLFQEEMERQRVAPTVTIFASDVDEGALATARQGIYPEAISVDVSEDRLARHFRFEDRLYRVANTIRDRVVFANHSLLRDPPFSRLHLVSCRNLLIYLDRELQERVMELFHYACRPEGYLFLGVSESANEEMFQEIDRKHRIFQVRTSAEDARIPLPASSPAVPRGLMRQERKPPAPRQAAAEIHLEALEAVAPPSLVVDRDWNVVHLSNSAARYLAQRGGPIARQVTDVVRPDLREEVHMVLHRAFEDSVEQQVSEFVLVRFNGTPRRVAVVAQCHRPAERDGQYVLLTFIEVGEASAEQLAADNEPGDDVVQGLREKLRQAELRADKMRDDFRMANEDLRAANEELQSLNEEYRSTTEELETSKEELQSVNEELQTVNHELKTKVEALSRTNDDLENLMVATSIPTLFLDRDMRIKRFTPQVSDIFNVTLRDVGRPIGDFTHRLEYRAMLDDARSVLAGKQVKDREVAADDGRFFVVRISPYLTEGDAAEGIVLTFVDVSLLKQAEAGLRQSEEEFRALVDASAQIVWRMDRHGRVASDSPTWRAYTGQSYEQWTDRWLDAVHMDDQAIVKDIWHETVEAGGDMATEFRVYHAPSQTWRWTTVRAVPLKEANGSVRGWIGMHIDVHESREVEEVLREADRRKDDFLAMLGHELRNPLAAIRSSVAVHQAAGDREDTSSRTWAIVDRQSLHMTRLINDLLDIVRIDRGKLRLQRESISLQQCIEDVVDAMRPRIHGAGLELRIELPHEPLHVYGDRERLAQVLDNLLRNAVTYTDAGGAISIDARRENDNAVITVRDTGIGMEADQLGMLFEPYRQIDGDRPGSGLGLGLTLAKRIVGLHGGSILARSDGPGTGSEFAFTIPVAEEEPAAAEEPVERPRPRRVLVVDDEADVADMFAAMLESLGQEVVVTYSGQQALDTMRTNFVPEIAFLDLSMPGMGGNELARSMREQLGSNAVCLVALSGFGIESRVEAGEFDRHLLKPASPEAVVELLNTLAPRC